MFDVPVLAQAEGDPQPAQRWPMLTIEAGARGTRFDFAELWSYRELLYFLTWRDIKVRYKQTVLGAAWAILQPVVAMVVFTLFFGKFAHVPSNGIPYPLFAYAGLLPWTFFANAVTSAGDSLVGSATLVSKVYFPRLVIPCAAVCAALVDLAIASVVLVGMMLWYGIAVRLTILMVPPLMLLATLVAVAVGMWTSALNVKYRDVRYALPFLIQIWMFATPVIYPATIVPERWRWMLALNPLTGLIENIRSALFGLSFDWPALATGAAITLTGLIYAAYSFRRMEREFADII